MVAKRVQRLTKADEVARDEFCTLMEQLIKGMLAVGAGLAPIDRAGIVVHARAVERDRLAVALHCELLEVRREAFQVLIVWQHRDRLGTEEVHIPNTD